MLNYFKHSLSMTLDGFFLISKIGVELTPTNDFWVDRALCFKNDLKQIKCEQ